MNLFQFVQDLVHTIVYLDKQGLVFVVGLILVAGLRLVTACPTWATLLGPMLFIAGLNPCIVGRANASFEVHNPLAHLVFQGLVLGAVAWGIYLIFLEDKVIKLLKKRFGARVNKVKC